MTRPAIRYARDLECSRCRGVGRRSSDGEPRPVAGLDLVAQAAFDAAVGIAVELDRPMGQPLGRRRRLGGNGPARNPDGGNGSGAQEVFHRFPREMIRGNLSYRCYYTIM